MHSYNNIIGVIKHPLTAHVRNSGPPTVPVQTSPGPTLTPTSTGFEIRANPLPESARSDPGQISLHTQLRRMADKLQVSIPRISNTHAALADEFETYFEFLTADLTDLNLFSLWCAGSGLSEHIRALDQAGPGVMTPELEPDIIARLRTLMNTHIAFILGFPEGQELHDRIIKGREAAQANPDLQDETQSVLKPMESQPRLLARKALKIVRSLLRGFGLAPSAAFDLLISSGEMARNSIYAFIKALHPILVANEAVGLAAVLAGYEHVDVLVAVAVFLRENKESVAALFAHDAQVIDWLAWAVQRMRDTWPE